MAQVLYLSGWRSEITSGMLDQLNGCEPVLWVLLLVVCAVILLRLYYIRSHSRLLTRLLEEDNTKSQGDSRVK